MNILISAVVISKGMIMMSDNIIILILLIIEISKSPLWDVFKKLVKCLYRLMKKNM